MAVNEESKWGGLSPRVYVRCILDQAEEPLWYHVNEQEELGINVPDGTYEDVVRSMADQGIRNVSHWYFCDFAPGVYVDEDGLFRVTRHKMFVGERNGERLTVLLSPVKKMYLPNKWRA